MSYQEDSRNGDLGERNFISKTATVIRNPKFSKVAAELGVVEMERARDQREKQHPQCTGAQVPPYTLSLGSTQPGGEAHANVYALFLLDQGFSASALLPVRARSSYLLL